MAPHNFIPRGFFHTWLTTKTYLHSKPSPSISSLVTPKFPAASATSSWSCARVAMTVNTLARMPGIEGKVPSVSVGWQ